MAKDSVHEQAEMAYLLARLFEKGLMRKESTVNKLFTLGGVDRKVREALYTAAQQIATSRGDNPRFAWLAPYSDENMQRVTTYLENVIGQTNNVAKPNANVLPGGVSGSANTYFRDLVTRQADQEQGTSLTIPRP